MTWLSPLKQSKMSPTYLGLGAVVLLAGINLSLGLGDLRVSSMGFFIGILIGLTGMGGGSLMAPFLILVLGVQPLLAVGSDLVYSSATKALGSAQHFTQGSVDLRVAKLLLLGSIPSSVLAISTLTFLKATYTTVIISGVVKGLLSVALVIAALFLVIHTLFLKNGVNHETHPPYNRNAKIRITLTGVLVGALVGLTSVGSGILVVVLLLLVYPLAPRRLVGTDIFHAMILTGVGGLIYFNLGEVSLPLVLAVLIGSLPGVLIGSRLTGKIPAKPLRIILVSIIILASFALLLKI